MTLKSIEEEAADCLAAFAGALVNTPALHCHHECLSEFLCEPAQNRIAYILDEKPLGEQALRLRLFRPVLNAEARAEWDKAREELENARAEWDNKVFGVTLRKRRAEWDTARAGWDKACEEWDKRWHARLCPDCPWDGRTIFPGVV